MDVTEKQFNHYKEAFRNPLSLTGGQREKRNRSFKTELTRINCNMGFAQMTQGEHSLPEFTDTKFGKSPVGSF